MERMWLLNKISCEIQILNEKVGKLMIENGKLEKENKNLNIKVASLEGEIKGLNYTIEKLKEENQYRESIADVLPEGKGHIAEETIQDLQKEIKRLNEELKWWKDLVHKAKEFEYDEDGMDYIWQNTKI